MKQLFRSEIIIKSKMVDFIITRYIFTNTPTILRKEIQSYRQSRNPYSFYSKAFVVSIQSQTTLINLLVVCSDFDI